MDKRAVFVLPALAERPRGKASNISSYNCRVIINDVKNSNIDTREDVFTININPLRNILRDT